MKIKTLVLGLAALTCVTQPSIASSPSRPRLSEVLSTLADSPQSLTLGDVIHVMGLDAGAKPASIPEGISRLWFDAEQFDKTAGSIAVSKTNSKTQEHDISVDVSVDEGAACLSVEEAIRNLPGRLAPREMTVANVMLANANALSPYEYTGGKNHPWWLSIQAGKRGCVESIFFKIKYDTNFGK